MDNPEHTEPSVNTNKELKILAEIASLNREFSKQEV